MARSSSTTCFNSASGLVMKLSPSNKRSRTYYCVWVATRLRLTVHLGTRINFRYGINQALRNRRRFECAKTLERWPYYWNRGLRKPSARRTVATESVAGLDHSKRMLGGLEYTPHATSPSI